MYNLTPQNLTYTWPFTSANSTNQGWESKNTVFHPWIVEPVDAKPTDIKGLLYLLKKTPGKWTHVVQTHVVQESII